MRALSSLLAVVSFTAGALAQVPGQGAPGQQPLPRQPAGTAQPLRPDQLQRDPLNSRWAMPLQPPPFQGFPSLFPQGLGAFGSYPVEGLPGAAGALPFPLLLQPTEPPGWPRWLRGRDADELPYVPGQALLVRHADRVWWKSPDEPAAVPLYFHDKVRSVVAGTELEVRQTGEFEILFHGGGRLVANGQVRVHIDAMDEKVVALQVPVFSKLRAQVSGREYRFVLPDGSVLTVPPDRALAEPEAEVPGPAWLVFERAIEPGCHGGRAALWNGGQRAVTWRHAFGETKLEPGHRLWFFLSPPPEPIGAALAVRGVDTTREGTALLCRSGGDAQVQWSGARFTLGAGTTLRLDPLAGDPFR
ncbi:MAG: hypothetical protein FJ265_18480 [Planctomycetes bacterium]|nr:hypothetical protein [Planctomycetota bacterium]